MTMLTSSKFDIFKRKRKDKPEQSEREAHGKILASTNLDATPRKALTDNCVVCGSAVKFEGGSSCFRCVVCATVNDLRAPTNEAEVVGLTVEEASQLEHVGADGYDAVLKRISIAFSSARCLNVSFVKMSWPTLADHGIDLAAVRDTFRLIAKDSSLLDYCTQTALTLLNRPGRRIKRAHDARFLMILLELPNLGVRTRGEGRSPGQAVLRQMLGLLSCLNNDLHTHFVNWFARYRPETFEARVDTIQAFLSHRLAKLRRSARHNYASDWQVKSAARVLALLYSANHMRRVPLPAMRFYNTYTDLIDLGADYAAWKSKASGFSFCAYPFLITLKAKQRLLSLDALRQQRLKVREAYFAALDSGKDLNAMLDIKVRRSHLLEDSLLQLGERETDLKKRLVVQFVGEDGVDAGGLKKEWFLLLCRQLFDTQHGLFDRDEESNYSWFSSTTWDRAHASSYFLLGTILGLAIYNQTILDVQLPPALFKKLVGQSCTLADLKVLHPALGSGLQKLLDYDGDVEATFCRNFVIERRGVTIPLCPDGHDIPVTNANRRDFVNRFVAYVFDVSCQRQMFHLSRGFHLVAGGNALSLLRAEEVELLVRGSPEALNLDDLKAVCEYEANTASEPVVTWFWQYFERIVPTRQRKLLSFITGSDRIPATGTVDLKFRITVDKHARTNRLPVAHTCFSQIVLPRYPSAAILEDKLDLAMHEEEFSLK